MWELQQGHDVKNDLLDIWSSGNWGLEFSTFHDRQKETKVAAVIL